MLITYTNPPNLSTPSGYSHVTSHGPGKLVHVAGQVSKDKFGRVVGAGDLTMQTERIYKNLGIALAAADADFSALVRVTTYVVDLDPEKAAEIRAVRNRLFDGATLPASTMVGVSSLASPELLIEIEAMAVTGPSTG